MVEQNTVAHYVSECILDTEAYFILGFDTFDLTCKVLIPSLPHFWLLVAGKGTVFQEQTVHPSSMVQIDSSRTERGRKSKAQEATKRK